MSAGIPKSSAEITPEWMTAALRAGNRVGETTVTEVVLEPMEAGMGYMGEVARLRLTSSGGTPPKTMIAS